MGCEGDGIASIMQNGAELVEHVQLLLLLIHEQHHWPRTNRRNARKSPKIQSEKVLLLEVARTR